MSWIYRKTIGRIVDMVESAILNYRLKLRMVPTSYKVFVWSLGVVFGSSAVFVSLTFPGIGAETIIIENVHAKEIVEVETVKIEKEVDLVDIIFTLESSRGKNNFSKCEAIGKYNRYGFGIPGNGEYICFDKDMDTVAVAGWIAMQRARGLSDDSLLCLYNTGKASDYCEYSEKARRI